MLLPAPCPLLARSRVTYEYTMASLQPKYPSTLVPNNQTSERNIHFILPILSPYLSALPASARVLELASGTGTHVSALAKAFPSLTFQPTECDDYGVAQVDQGVAKLAGVQPAIKLDVVEAEGWSALEATVEGQDRPWDLVYAANYAHMIPHPEGHEAIFRHLRTSVNKAHGKFCVYGPFKTDAGFLSEGDAKVRGRLKRGSRWDDVLTFFAV